MIKGIGLDFVCGGFGVLEAVVGFYLFEVIGDVAAFFGADDVVGFRFSVSERAKAHEVGVLAVECAVLPVGVYDVCVGVVHEVSEGLVFEVREAVCGGKFAGFEDAGLGINAGEVFCGDEFCDVVGVEGVVLAFVARVKVGSFFLFDGADVVLPDADVWGCGDVVRAVAVNASCELDE